MCGCTVPGLCCIQSVYRGEKTVIFPPRFPDACPNSFKISYLAGGGGGETKQTDSCEGHVTPQHACYGEMRG